MRVEAVTVQVVEDVGGVVARLVEDSPAILEVALQPRIDVEVRERGARVDEQAETSQQEQRGRCGGLLAPQ
jgi:hypothetical protein